MPRCVRRAERAQSRIILFDNHKPFVSFLPGRGAAIWCRAGEKSMPLFWRRIAWFAGFAVTVVMGLWMRAAGYGWSATLVAPAAVYAAFVLANIHGRMRRLQRAARATDHGIAGLNEKLASQEHMAADAQRVLGQQIANLQSQITALHGVWALAIENDRHLELNAERVSDAGKPEALIDDRRQAVGEQSIDRTFTDAAVPQTTFLFVGHTATYPTNPGVQRTVRGLATGLAANGVRTRYLKWDAAIRECVLIDNEERAHLSKWNGPSLTDEEKGIYAAPGQSAVVVETAAGNDRLIVPEVFHSSNPNQCAALDLIIWARQRRIEIGFIFFDAIPLLRTEFAAMAPAHAQYMQHLRLADVVWPISRWAGRDLISFWSFWTASERTGFKTLPRVLTLHLPAGIASRQRKSGSPHHESLILSVGTVEKRKNQLQLVRAFRAHRESNPQSPWQLVLVGSLHANIAGEFQNAVRSDASIRYLGGVSDEILEGLYSSCAFTVFPSVEEGFGLPILESLAHGKPCICANFGAMAELIEGGGCLAVDTRDPASLRGAMEELINNVPLRQSLTEQAGSRSMIGWSDYAASVSESAGARRNSGSCPPAHEKFADTKFGKPN
jgi:glycosyltransferase involved in cell wall biosynthesis